MKEEIKKYIQDMENHGYDRLAVESYLIANNYCTKEELAAALNLLPPPIRRHGYFKTLFYTIVNPKRFFIDHLDQQQDHFPWLQVFVWPFLTLTIIGCTFAYILQSYFLDILGQISNFNPWWANFLQEIESIILATLASIPLGIWLLFLLATFGIHIYLKIWGGEGKLSETLFIYSASMHPALVILMGLLPLVPILQFRVQVHGLRVLHGFSDLKTAAFFILHFVIPFLLFLALIATILPYAMPYIDQGVLFLQEQGIIY